jgi:hypothetical protein
MTMHASITDTDIISMLKHSSLPTILVEGDTDIAIIRRIQERHNIELASLQQCGGRNTLLKVYERRNEIKNVKVVFVADQDKYLYTGIPTDYADVVFTKGYSIENDLYHDSAIVGLMTNSDKAILTTIVSNFSKWYARQVYAIELGQEVELDTNPHHIIFDYHPFDLQQTYQVADINIDQYRSTYDRVVSNYSLEIRGHSLMTIVGITFRNRPTGENRYGDKHLTEIAITAANLPVHLNELVNRIVNKLAEAN